MPEVNEGQTRFEVRFEIVARFTNQTADTVWLLRCTPDISYPMFGVRMLDDGESAYDQLWGCVGHSQHFEVGPGVSRVDTIPLFGPTQWEDDEIVGDFEGRMRLSYRAMTCPEPICPEHLPDSLSRPSSNAFDVRLPEGVMPP